MKGRRTFLTRLFELLDERAIPFVVLRNFSLVYEEKASDVDLLAANAGSVFAAAQVAAQETGLRLVQRARFLNHTWVWWDGECGFTRVDVDTALRWRWFEGPSTDGILERRIRYDTFWVPSPDDELAALRMHIASRGFSSERYDRRLVELGAPFCNPRQERRALIREDVLDPRRWLSIARHFWDDVTRYSQRRRHPPGQAIFIATAGEFDSERVQDYLALLFPPMLKAKSDDRTAIRRAVFAAGLSLRTVQKSEAALVPTLRMETKEAPTMHNHAFAMMGKHRGAFAGDADGGWMWSDPNAESAEVGAKLARFICESRARNLEQSERRRGRSVLLVGVDGAGKTTLARMLFERAMGSKRFTGCRYFHWIPPLSRSVDFPWPISSDQPRHSGSFPKMSSLFRLWRNVVRAQIAWRMRVLPLVRKGRLVLLDRFLANYWLDPESVRYGAGDFFLGRAIRWIPKADVMIALDAEPEVLAARKGELSIEQIRAQQERLRSLPDLAFERLNLDAARPPNELVEDIFTRLETQP